MTVYLRFVERRSTTRNNTRSTRKNRKYKFSHILYTLLGTIVVLGLCYGLLANKVVTVAYDVQSAEIELSNLRDKNDELKIEISELQSVQILEDKIVEMGMIESTDTDYINIGKEVALRR